MANLWKEVNELLLADHKKLTIKDVKEDIKWLYQRKNQKMPEIILFESIKEFNAYVKKMDFKYWQISKNYGLKHEIDFIVYHSENPTQPDLRRYSNFIKKGVFSAKFENDKALICMLPKKILLNDKNEFHSLKGAAVQWHDSKSDKYYIHGRRFAKDLFMKIKDRKLPMLKVMQIKNIEQRYITLQLYGIERLMEELKPELIDESKKGNKLYLHKVDEDLTLNFLLYSCPSTANNYTKFVNPDTHNNNADQAMALSHNMTLEQYLSMENEG